MPKSNGLFISGSAVTTAKPARAAKVNLGQRTTQPTEASNTNGRGRPQDSNGHLPEGEEEEDEEEADQEQSPEESNSLKSFHLLTSSTLPDNPRKAAIVLAARQKNHRPLPDLMLESRDILIPRGWNHPGATAVTVETTKAKGPTSCTKRTIMRLLPPEGTESEGQQQQQRRPNVMELAIKWDVSSPPSSAGTSRKKAVKPAMGGRPVEKTLEWLYDPPVIYRPAVKRPDIHLLRRNKTVTNGEASTTAATSAPVKAPDSGHSSRHSSTASIVGNGRSCPMEGRNGESDPESGYNSPRSADGEPVADSGSGRKAAAGLTDLDDPVKAAYRSAASSAATIPPKNHFLVSTSDYGVGRRNSNNESVILPEYPLQRRSPVHQSIKPALPSVMDTTTTTSNNKQRHQSHPAQKYPANEYPVEHHHHHHHHCDRSDSGIGDLHDRDHDREVISFHFHELHFIS